MRVVRPHHHAGTGQRSAIAARTFQYGGRDMHVTVSAGLALNRRHVACIEEARSALSRVADRVPDGAAELIALELREVHVAHSGLKPISASIFASRSYCARA